MPKRERITFTIREDLLRALDRTIDHQRVRNRSHALEVVLSRALTAPTSQAVILASGQGVNMRPFTYEVPKPLIPVKGRPLLEHSLSMLRAGGIKDIVITVSHLAEKIQEHFGDGSGLGLNITYVVEKKLRGTGSSLYAARHHLDQSSFIVLYGDVLLDLDLAEFLQVHRDNKTATGTLALASVADPSAFGAVRLRGSRVVEFSEKPSSGATVSHLVFAGCAIFNHDIFNIVKPHKNRELSLEQDIFPALIKNSRLYGYPFEGQWFDVSTPSAYAEVIKHWQTKL